MWMTSHPYAAVDDTVAGGPYNGNLLYNFGQRIFVMCLATWNLGHLVYHCMTVKEPYFCLFSRWMADLIIGLLLLALDLHMEISSTRKEFQLSAFAEFIGALAVSFLQLCISCIGFREFKGRKEASQDETRVETEPTLPLTNVVRPPPQAALVENRDSRLSDSTKRDSEVTYISGLVHPALRPGSYFETLEREETERKVVK